MPRSLASVFAVLRCWRRSQNTTCCPVFIFLGSKTGYPARRDRMSSLLKAPSPLMVMGRNARSAPNSSRRSCQYRHTRSAAAQTLYLQKRTYWSASVSVSTRNGATLHASRYAAFFSMGMRCRIASATWCRARCRSTSISFSSSTVPFAAAAAVTHASSSGAVASTSTTGLATPETAAFPMFRTGSAAGNTCCGKIWDRERPFTSANVWICCK
mmetsp:Transcript_4429/g.9296  ORF Transcript_4429/g.9296 Transcript_4429/m.9296 type:complete len:213 (-) Transcript_4429:94-732(-)